MQGLRKTNNRGEAYMTKTHAELNVEFLAAALDCSKQLQEIINFLEELKNDMRETIEKYNDGSDFQNGKIDAYQSVLKRIEQFQAEQKVNDEPTSNN
jgi:hypothetical protein